MVRGVTIAGQTGHTESAAPIHSQDHPARVSSTASGETVSSRQVARIRIPGNLKCREEGNSTLIWIADRLMHYLKPQVDVCPCMIYQSLQFVLPLPFHWFHAVSKTIGEDV